jgi:hypothetical protein
LSPTGRRYSDWTLHGRKIAWKSLSPATDGADRAVRRNLIIAKLDMDRAVRPDVVGVDNELLRVRNANRALHGGRFEVEIFLCYLIVAYAAKCFSCYISLIIGLFWDFCNKNHFPVRHKFAVSLRICRERSVLRATLLPCRGNPAPTHESSTTEQRAGV